jgi:hypothetical protein
MTRQIEAKKQEEEKYESSCISKNKKKRKSRFSKKTKNSPIHFYAPKLAPSYVHTHIYQSNDNKRR